jgi:hypothetical protein
VVTVDADETIATWRRAEARIYPSVMVNATLYQQYIGVVRAVIEELGDVHTEADLLAAWEERRDVAAEVVRRLAPTMATMMDVEAVRDAAFCQRHRDITREQAKEIARQRLEDARRTGAEWVTLFDDATPLGSHRLEMHVRTGRAVHSSSEVGLDDSRPTYAIEVVQLDPATGAWLVDQPPIMPSRQFRTQEEWEARIAQARSQFGRS